MTKTPSSPHPPSDFERLLMAEPDLVDRIFDYVVELIPELAKRGEARIAGVKNAVREEFAGTDVYIAKRQGSRSRLDPSVAYEVLQLFNGRNATEIARRLNISRATVYRVIKQPGKKSSPVSGT